MREEKSGKLMLVKKADLLLFFAVLAVGAALLLVYRMSLGEGRRVRVSVDGEVVLELSLDDDHEEEISTAYGKNMLIIKNGEAYISEADCPDKICVKHKAVSKAGETIICLPHKLVVEVT